MTCCNCIFEAMGKDCGCIREFTAEDRKITKRDEIVCTLFLIDNPEFPNRKYGYGETSLHYLTKLGMKCYIPLLLEYGGDPFIKNFGNITPYDIACKKEPEIQTIFDNFISMDTIKEPADNL
jgi:hypothetical protein